MTALADWPALYGFAFFGVLGFMIGLLVGAAIALMDLSGDWDEDS